MLIHVPTSADLEIVKMALERANPVLSGLTPTAVLASTLITQPFRNGRDAAANKCFMFAAGVCCAENLVAYETHSVLGSFQLTCSALANLAAAGMLVARFTDYKPTADTVVRLIKVAPPLLKIFGLATMAGATALTVAFDGKASVLAAGMATIVYLWRTKNAGWQHKAIVAIGGGIYTACNYEYFDDIAWSQALMRVGLLAMILAEAPVVLPPIHRVLVESGRRVARYLRGFFAPKPTALAP